MFLVINVFHDYKLTGSPRMHYCFHVWGRAGLIKALDSVKGQTFKGWILSEDPSWAGTKIVFVWSCLWWEWKECERNECAKLIISSLIQECIKHQRLIMLYTFRYFTAEVSECLYRGFMIKYIWKPVAG